jgi:hypothetical protein
MFSRVAVISKGHKGIAIFEMSIFKHRFADWKPFEREAVQILIFSDSDS